MADPSWDAFLEEFDLGHFQQSSHWAKVKSKEGWHTIRCRLHQEERITGGFQLLWKQKFRLNIGYISKGPVCDSSSTETIEELVAAAVHAAGKVRLAALIVQPPNHGDPIGACFSRFGFFSIPGSRITNATNIIDLDASLDTLHKRMRRTVKQQVRQAVKRQVVVREGTIADTDDFFELMKKTCRRQKTRPNPGNADALRIFWNSLSGKRNVRLTLAERDGRKIAGLFCVGFGKRLILWKKGSDPDYLRTHAMSLLYWDALEWAKKNGFRSVDFFAMNRTIAEKLLSGIPLSDQERSSRDCFNLGFGGHPELIPTARIRFTNPMLNLFCRFSVTLLRRT